MMNYLGLISVVIFGLVYTSPSIRLSINQDKLNDIEKIIINNLLINSSLSIDPFDIVQKIDLFGTFEVNVSYPKLIITKVQNDSVSLQFKNSTIQSNKNTFILVDAKEIDSVFNLRYKFDSNFYNSEALCNITVSNISAKLNISLFPLQNMYEPYKMGPTANINGFHLPYLPSFSFNCLNKDNTYQDSSIIQNLFDSYMPFIEKKITKDYFPLLNDYIDNYMKYFHLKQSVTYKDTQFTGSFSMNEPPIILSSPKIQNITLYELSFEFLLSSNKDPSIYIKNESIIIPHVDVDSVGLKDDAAILIINIDLLSNMMYVLKNSNNLNAYVNSNVTYPFELKIGILADVIPQLINFYENYSLPMDLNFTCDDYPLITFQEGKINAKLYYIMDIIVQNEVAISGRIVVNSVFNIEILQGKIKMDIENIIFEEYKLLKSKIGEVDEKEVLDNFNEAMDLLLITINEIIGYVVERIKIPKIFGINVEKVDCEIGINYMKLGISPYLD